MAKNTKLIANLTKRIAQLEAEMKDALQKKVSGKVAYDVPATVRKINDLKADLKKLM